MRARPSAAAAAVGGSDVIEARLRIVPWWAWLILFIAIVAALPVGFESGYVRRVAFDTVIFMLLALGLNVVVGWGGLLDLGYVAFYGVGAYTYAILSADRYDFHLPVFVSIPAAAVIGGIVGLLVGLPSRRLVGDYLAIVTLFFFQIFLTVSNNSDSIFGDNVAGGPNGILNVQPLSLFGHELPVSHEGIFNVALPLRRARLLCRRVHRAAIRERIPHRARVAVAARGCAGSGVDGHAGQLAEADRLCLRRRASPL